jgi:hypothetical protein
MTDGQMGGWAGGRTDRQMEGVIDKRMDEQTDR